jgi:hypothetical protein
MGHSAKIMLLALACLLPTVAIGQQECGAVSTSSLQQAEDYINSAADAESSPCVKTAFGRIASFPPSVAVPTLIKYLGYKRPFRREGEILMHGPMPEEFYPAIAGLCSIAENSAGKPLVEAKLADFIGFNENAKGIALENALYTLVLIHHFDLIPIIQELHKESTMSASIAASDRLQDAARTVAGWCSGELKSKCIGALER